MPLSSNTKSELLGSQTKSLGQKVKRDPHNYGGIILAFIQLLNET